MPKKAKIKKSKKAVVKSSKAVAKPKVEVIIKQRLFGEAPEEHHFYLQDGRKLKSVYELMDSLIDMGEDTFRQHVNEFKNDFATWVKDVFKEEDIAKEIATVNNKVEMQRVLLKKIFDEVEKLKHAKHK